MTKQEIEDYFEAVSWFCKQYEKNPNHLESSVVEMWKYWPNATTLLVSQGFFMAIALRN